MIYKAATLYLAVPYFLFFLGWLHIPLALLLSVGLGFALYRFLKYAPDSNLSPRVLWFCLAFSFLGTLGSGFGFFQGGLGDALKHQTMLFDLVMRSWPVVYDEFPDATYVNYNAIYLVPALIGKVTSWKIANAAFFLWLWLGVFLATLVFIELAGERWFPLKLLVLLIFGGMDIIGHAIFDAPMSPFHFRMETWNEWAPLVSLTGALYTSPQHVLPGLILTSLVLKSLDHRAAARYALFLWILALFWSPFVWVGLIPLLVYSQYRHQSIDPFTGFVLAPAFVLLFSTYYLSVDALPVRGWAPFSFYPKIAIVLILEVAFIVIFNSILVVSKDEKKLLYLSAIALTLIPLYQLGMYNDFVQRATIPWLFILCLLSSRCLLETSDRRKAWARYTLAFVLLLGSLGSLTALRKSILELEYGYFSEEELRATPSIALVEIGPQYRGRVDSVFNRYFGR